MYLDTEVYARMDQRAKRRFNVIFTVVVILFLAWLLWYVASKGGPAENNGVLLLSLLV